MNRFRFRFQSVLRFRQAIEDEKKRNLAGALDHYTHEQEKLNLIDTSIDTHDTVRVSSAEGAVSAKDLLNKFIYARHLERVRDGQEKHLQKAGKEVAVRRTDLVEAAKQKKILERLRERDQEAHQDEIEHEERAISDEIATQRYHRDKDA